mmetsp:Transcript_51043/g.94395  ORF Transcript_51043/g.94395 Transcript_51043/m.94395 type:complete len:188 (+) Transcript_51043:67-630(+)
MAWDLAFNEAWAQRIEKEEKAFLEAHGAYEEIPSIAGFHSRGSTGRVSTGARIGTGSQSRLRTPASPLPNSGGQVLRSRQGSRHGTANRQSRSTPNLNSGTTLNIPSHFQAISKFPVQEKDIMTARVDGAEPGTVPRLRFHKEEVKAMWWPMKGHYVKWRPEFSFEDAPAWLPEDIIRERPKKKTSQ